MTITKKMLIAGILAVSTQFGVFAWSDIAEYKQVINFTQELRRLGDVEPVKVADWLDAIVNQRYGFCLNYGEQMFILVTIDTIGTVEKKMMTLQKLMAEHEQARAQQAEKNEAFDKKFQEENRKYEAEQAASNRRAWMNKLKYDLATLTVGTGGAMFSMLSAMLLFETISGVKLFHS